MVFPAARAFFQRAFANEDKRALAAVPISLLGLATGLDEVIASPRNFAHLALAAAEIAARPAALILRCLGRPLERVGLVDELCDPRISSSCACSELIRSLRSAARRSSCADKLDSSILAQFGGDKQYVNPGGG